MYLNVLVKHRPMLLNPKPRCTVIATVVKRYVPGGTREVTASYLGNGLQDCIGGDNRQEIQYVQTRHENLTC